MDKAKALGCYNLQIDGLAISFGPSLPPQASGEDDGVPRKGAFHPFPTSPGSPEKGAEAEPASQDLVSTADRQAADEWRHAQLLIDDPVAFEQEILDGHLERERQRGQSESRGAQQALHRS